MTKECEFSENGDIFVCAACGRRSRPISGKPPRAVCGAMKKPSGLGDMVASGLSAVGITEDRVKAVTGLSDCGCGKRKEWLNEAGRKYLGIGDPPPQ